MKRNILNKESNMSLSVGVAVLLLGVASVMVNAESTVSKPSLSFPAGLDAQHEARIWKDVEKEGISEDIVHVPIEQLQWDRHNLSSDISADSQVVEGAEEDLYTTYGIGAGTAEYGSFFGSYAGANTTGLANTFMGDLSGMSNTIGELNVFIGAYSGIYNIGGSKNTFLGFNSGYKNTEGSNNTFIGEGSGYENTSESNTFVGSVSGLKNTVGRQNTFNGYSSGTSNIDGNFGTFSGAWSGATITNGDFNTFIGYASGYESGLASITTSNNTYIGAWAGGYNETGHYNIFLGTGAGLYESGSYKLYIDSSSTSTPLIYGEFDTNLIRVNGTFETALTEESTANNKNIVALDRNNTGTGGSDVGFSLENVADDYKWTFRTYAPVEGFAASKIGTGGTEFEVGNTGTDLSTTVVKMGGVVVFEDGHLVDTNGEELINLVQAQNVKLAAQDKLLAETRADVKVKDAEIIAMKAKITNLEMMQKKVAMMESILTNLALDTFNTKTEKVSLNRK